MILIKPVLTEKSIRLADSGIFTFIVSPTATKSQIKIAIKDQFSVDPVSVNTTKIKSLTRRSRKTGQYQKIRAKKKAYVTLKPKQTIELFNLKK
jgi:large subunit ribosomal protein L23